MSFNNSFKSVLLFMSDDYPRLKMPISRKDCGNFIYGRKIISRGIIESYG